MKHTDISHHVMKKVAVLEKQRISVWIRNFIIIIGFFAIAICVTFFLIVQDLLEKHAFDVFELFFQDREIIAEFGKEVLNSFWDEIPMNLSSIVGILIGLCICAFLVTRVRRSIIRNKVHHLDKYM